MVELKSSNAKSPNNENSVAKLASTRGLDFIITSTILLIFFLTPLFFTGLVAQGLGFEKIILFYFLVLIGLVAWVTKGVILGELNLKRTPLDLPIVATIVVFAISTALSVSVKDSLIGSYGNSAKGLVALVIMSLFYYLLVNNLNTKRIKQIFWTIIASGGILVIYSLLQLSGVFLLPLKFTVIKSFNPIGSLSGLTMYIVMILPLLVIAATQTKEILPKAAKIVVIAIKTVAGIIALSSLAILALLNGFTFWPVAIVGAVIVLMFFLAKIIKVSNNNLLIPLATFLALIILLVIGNFSLFDLKLPAEVSLSRSASWEIAKDSVKENPIFGSGPSTFFYDFAKHKSLDFNASPLWNVRFDSASGAIFELLATVGVAGVLALATLVLIALSISFLTLIKNTNKEINSILLGLFAALVSSVLLAILFSQNNSLILLLAILSIFSVSASLVMYPEKFKILKLSFRASPKYALALAAIFLSVSAGVVVLFTMGLKTYMADIYARQALASGDINEKIAKLNRSVALAPYQDAYYLRLANHYMALANQAAVSGKNQADIGTNLSQAIERGKKAVAIADNKASNNESLALIYENASFYTRGALEWSEQLYEKVIELDPQNPTPYLRIALVNMARANAEQDAEEKKFYIGEAIKKYDEAIKKKGDLAAAYYGKAIAREKLGDTDDAIEQLKRANLVSQNNLDYRFELGRMFFNRGVVQPNLSQTASQQIAENDIDPNATGTPEIISVQPSATTGATVTKNSDLAAAEQLFLSILLASPKHANARYSLAVLYQKTGELDNAKVMVNSLLDTLQDQQTIKAVQQQFVDILR